MSNAAALPWTDNTLGAIETFQKIRRTRWNAGGCSGSYVVRRIVLEEAHQVQKGNLPVPALSVRKRDLTVTLIAVAVG